jgi:methylmalonyl-CoA mutase N-terminal domain/subunit
VVGVSKDVEPDTDQKIETHTLGPGSDRRQIARIPRVKRERDLDRIFLEEVAREPDENLMPATLIAVNASASMGEIVNALRDVFSPLVEHVVF